MNTLTTTLIASIVLALNGYSAVAQGVQDSWAINQDVTVVYRGSMLGTVNIPKRIHEVVYYAAKDGFPMWECDYTLQTLSTTPVDASKFSQSSLLNNHCEIETVLHGTDIVVPGYRSDMSLADQELQAYFAQKAADK